MEEIFYEYVKKYDLSIVEIDNKYHHSLRVRDLCGEIASYLGMNESDITLARQIGLLHDIGRFEEWKRKHTYHSNIDHGDLGVEILFKEGLIDKFGIIENLDIIRDCVKYHDNFELPELDNRTLLFCNIVRDADKIDIIYLMSNNEYNILENTNDSVSDIVRADFFNGKSVNNKDKRNANDDLVCILAFMNNMVFGISKEYILEKKYLEELYKGLKYKEPLKEFFEEIGVIKC